MGESKRKRGYPIEEEMVGWWWGVEWGGGVAGCVCLLRWGIGRNGWMRVSPRVRRGVRARGENPDRGGNSNRRAARGRLAGPEAGAEWIALRVCRTLLQLLRFLFRFSARLSPPPPRQGPG